MELALIIAMTQEDIFAHVQMNTMGLTVRTGTTLVEGTCAIVAEYVAMASVTALVVIVEITAKRLMWKVCGIILLNCVVDVLASK